MEIEFKGKQKKKQYFKAIALMGHPSRKRTIIRVAMFILVAGLYVGYVITLYQDLDPSTREIGGTFRHAFTVLLFAYVVFAPYIKSWQVANRMWKDPIIRNPIPGKITTQGIVFSLSTEIIEKWEVFSRVEKSESLTVLMTTANNIMVLPRSFFQSDHAWSRANSIIDQYVVKVQ